MIGTPRGACEESGAAAAGGGWTAPVATPRSLTPSRGRAYNSSGPRT